MPSRAAELVLSLKSIELRQVCSTAALLVSHALSSVWLQYSPAQRIQAWSSSCPMVAPYAGPVPEVGQPPMS